MRAALVLLASLLAIPLAPAAQAADPPEGARAEEPPLRAGVLPDAAPFVVRRADGTLTGFIVELFRLIAARMDRQIAFEADDEATLDDKLAHGGLDIIAGPVAATPDRAYAMLLTEGYAWSEYQFGARADQPVTRLEDLRGRRLAFRSGSAYAEWAGRNAGRYGFTLVPAKSGLAAAGLVVDSKADASLTGSPVQSYAAHHVANFAAGLSLPETRTHESAAMRRGDAELRDEVEDAMRCLKIKGIVAQLARTWFDRDPDAEDLENLVVPGYGVPGLAGYDPKPRKSRC